jgi:hypothetical protein
MYILRVGGKLQLQLWRHRRRRHVERVELGCDRPLLAAQSGVNVAITILADFDQFWVKNCDFLDVTILFGIK